MTVVRLLVLYSLLALLAACNGGGGSGESVEVNTSGIFNPVSLSYNNVEIQPVHDLGEFLLGTPKKVYLFKIRNNSLYKITQMNVTMDGFSSFGFKFNKDPNGLSAYPGYTGNCTDSLPPGGICNVALQFETSIKGQYEQDITFKYTNLVESAVRPLKLIMLAGNAASLIFDGEITNYSFGTKVGIGQIPVVEKDDNLQYEQTVTISNAGDLRARDIKLLLSQECQSEATGECPAGQNIAYSYTTTCPAILAANETCQATIKYYPKNQDADPANPNPVLKEIRFNSTLKFDYLNSQEAPNNKAALNAYFTSVSTNIEGNFKTSIDSLPFETQLTVGNRLQKSVRINNKGFREGQLRFLVIEKGGVDIGYCIRGTTLFMNCYTDAAFTNSLTLAAFPFYFRDKNSCFGTSAVNDGAVVNVDGGCQLDLFFQPSITYKTAGTNSFKLKAEYDSHWKDNVVLRRNFFLTSGGTHLAAARLIPEKITFGGTSLTPTSLHALNEIMSFDMGRVGMMSPNAFKRKALEITFLNVGDVLADNITSTDGWGFAIPKKEENPAGIDLKPGGGDNKPWYSATKVSTAFCNQIPPGGRCTISINFAPISKGSVEASRTYMFDNNNLADPLNSFKSFFFNYRDGSLYSDTNRLDVVDTGAGVAQARLKAVLVAKGIIGDINQNTLEVPGGPHPPSRVTKSYVIISNIGTDKVRYIGYTGDTKFDQTTGLKVVDSDLATIAADHAGELFGPLKDCKGIIDFDYDKTKDCSVVDPKLLSAGNPTGLGFLGADESCALSIERTPSLYMLTENTGDTGPGHELGRLMIKDYLNTEKIWEFKNQKVFIRTDYDYFDNDTSNTNAVGLLGSCVGSEEKTNGGTKEIEFLKPGRLVPHSPYPKESAILYRRGYTLPELRTPTNVLVKNPFVIPESWYFSGNNVDSLATSTDLDVNIVTAAKSKNYFPSSVNISPLDMNDYDYVVHLGTFPVGKTIQTGFMISAGAKSLQSIWKGSTSTLIMRPPASTQTDQFGYFLNIPLNTAFPGSDIKFPATLSQDIRINFTADTDGVFASEFKYTYRNGDYDGTPANMIEIEQKILVIGEALADAPDLEVQVASYKVTTDGFSAPVLTPATPDLFVPADYTPYVASAGDAALNEWILLDAVKIPSPVSTDYFVRKHVKIKNTSTINTLSLMNVVGKTAPSATMVTSLNFGNNIKFCFDNSAAQCKGTCGGKTSLTPGESCYFEVYYQPNDAQVAKDITISANFKIKDNQHFARNIRFSFLPKDPAIVFAQGKSKEAVRVAFGNMSSYPLDFGTTTEISADPQIVAFDKSAGLMKRLQVLNSSGTRASFLKAYHEWQGTTNTNLIPSDASYTYNQDGVNYTLIYQRNYTSGQPRIQVYATKPCLIGGATAEDDALPLFQKGFNSATIDPCYIAIVLKANTHYQNIELITSSATLMEPNHVRLPFYDNDRSSFSYFNVHFRGKLKPNGSTGAPNNATAYHGVQASSNGTVTFKWNEMSPKNPALGAIVGYRIYYSTSQSALTDVYLATASKVDDFNVPNATGIYQMTQTALTSKKYYYYRVVPIREYNNYISTQTFPGVTPFYQLTGKRYLSETLVPQLTVVVPPPDMYYDHARQLLISRNVKTSDLLTIAQARTACTSMTKLRLSKSGGNADFTNRLISQNAWNSIVEYPAESLYNPYTLSVWLDGTTQNIHATLLPIPGYNPLDEAKYLTANTIFYQKASLCQPNCSGDKAVGTVYHNPEFGGYSSYVSAGYVFASARCHVNLLAP